MLRNMPVSKKSAIVARNYKSEILTEALNKVISGTISKMEACKQYQIPPDTLFYKLAEQTQNSKFTKSEEDIFENHLLLLSAVGIPLRMLDCRVIVKQYLDTNNMVMETFPDNLPGNDWTILFLERHPKIKQKILKKYAEVDKKHIEAVFQNLSEQIDGVLPHNIYNMAEIGFHEDAREEEEKLLFQRECTHPDIIKNSVKSCCTVIFCGNAAGEALLPYFIFKGNQLNPDLLFQAPSGSGMAVSKTGWINASIFENWLEFHFIPFVNKTQGKKILLCDPSSAHISLRAFEMCDDNDIKFICLLSNSTPLNVGYFKSLEIAWRDILNEYREKSNEIETFPIALFVRLFIRILNSSETLSADNIRAGFQKHGIYPFSPQSVKSTLSIFSTDEHFFESIDNIFIAYKDDIYETRGFRLPLDPSQSVTAEDVKKYRPENEKLMKDKENLSNWTRKRGFRLPLKPGQSVTTEEAEIIQSKLSRENKENPSKNTEQTLEIKSECASHDYEEFTEVEVLDWDDLNWKEN